MYIKNKRDSSDIKGCSPFEPSCKLKVFCFEIAYFSYTEPLAASLTQSIDEIHCKFIIKMFSKKTKYVNSHFVVDFTTD